MKKKLSVGLVLAIVLLLIAVVAFATAVISSYFDRYANLEGSYGQYEQWPATAKVELVRMMKETGLSVDEAKVQLLLAGNLPSEQQGMLADEIIMDYFGGTDYMSTFNIMQHELSESNHYDWPQEYKVLYNELSKQYGLDSSELTDYRMPDENGVSQQEAVLIAQQTLMQTYNLSEKDFATYTLAESSYFAYDDDKEPHWLVLFAGDGSDPKYETNIYAVYLSSNGDVKRTVAPVLSNDLNEAFDNLLRERGAFVTWTLEEKYEFVQIWLPKVKQLQSSDVDTEQPSRYLNYLAEKPYRLPDKADIPKSKALEYADAAFEQETGRSDNVEEQYIIYTSFMLNVEGNRIWRFFYVPKQRVNTDCGYRIDINAKTGEVDQVVHRFAEMDTWATFYE